VTRQRPDGAHATIERTASSGRGRVSIDRCALSEHSDQRCRPS
jgi:hypothetical protein